jgi:hypothetical protein
LKHIMDSGPVHERAWQLQERFVSRRTLYCCKEQLYWQCKRGTGNESFPNSLLTGPEGSLTSAAVKILDRIAKEGSWKLSKTGKMVFQPPSDKKVEEDAYSEWLKLIETYTSRGLARHKDVLVAFSGIAKRFEVLLGDQYLSGLLAGDIHANLLWFTKDPSVTRLSTETEGSGDEDQWQAPTWSWAAVKGKVEWDHTFLADPRYRGEPLEGNLLEYIGHENIKLISDSKGGVEPPKPKSGLRVKALRLLLFGYFHRPPTATALETTGIHSRVIWIRSSFEKVHHGVGQFDSPEIIQQLAMENSGLEFGSVIGIPVRWKLENSLVAGVRERTLRITGLLLRPATSRVYSENLEVLHRIGRFIFQVPQPVGSIAAEDPLMRYLKEVRDLGFKEHVLV